MEQPQAVLAQQRNCPLCGGKRVAGELVSGQYGVAFMQTFGADFNPMNRPIFSITPNSGIIMLACTNCGFMGMFVAHPENLVSD